MIWRRRERLAQLQPVASLSGIALVIAAGLLWVFGSLTNATIIQDLAAVALIPLSFWAVLGRRVTSEITFPLFYLLFMIPFGEFLVPHLMDFTADFTVAALRLSAVPVYRDGLFLKIPNGSFRVIEACSGVRMLIASVAVGVLFAHLSFRSWNRRILFLLGTVFLAMLTNGLRAYTLVMIGHLIGMEAVSRHIVLGYIFFGVFIIVLLGVGSHFSDKGDDDEPSPVVVDEREGSRSGLLGFVTAASVIAVIALAPMTAAGLRALVMSQPPVQPMQLPAANGRWSGPGEAQIDWEPVYIGSYAQSFGRYVDGPRAVDVYAITYGRQTAGSELISATNTMFDPKAWILARENPASTELPLGEAWDYVETELLADTRKRLIRYWYTVNGKPSNSQVQVKLAELKNAVMGQSSSSSVVAVSTEFLSDVEAAGATLDDFFTTVFADSYIQPD